MSADALSLHDLLVARLRTVRLRTARLRRVCPGMVLSLGSSSLRSSFPDTSPPDSLSPHISSPNVNGSPRDGLSLRNSSPDGSTLAGVPRDGPSSDGSSPDAFVWGRTSKVERTDEVYKGELLGTRRPGKSFPHHVVSTYKTCITNGTPTAGSEKIVVPRKVTYR